jgi:hypothetical protein
MTTINDLPHDVLSEIFAYFVYKPALAAVCRKWASVLGDIEIENYSFALYALGLDDPIPAFTIFTCANKILRECEHLERRILERKHCARPKIKTRVVKYFCAHGRALLAREIFEAECWNEGFEAYLALHEIFPKIRMRNVLFSHHELTEDIARIIIKQKDAQVREYALSCTIAAAYSSPAHNLLFKSGYTCAQEYAYPAYIYFERLKEYEENFEYILADVPRLFGPETPRSVQKFMYLKRCAHDVRIKWQRAKTKSNVRINAHILYDYLARDLLWIENGSEMDYVADLAYILAHNVAHNFASIYFVLGLSGIDCRASNTSRALIDELKSLGVFKNDALRAFISSASRTTHTTRIYAIFPIQTLKYACGQWKCEYLRESIDVYTMVTREMRLKLN